MNSKTIALVKGDGSGPEMMEVACKVATVAAKKDGLELLFLETPMGWNAYHLHGDTLPPDSLRRAVKIGTIFFGGVGDFKNDETIGKEKPEMKPEARALLPIRKEMGLLLNFRPMIYYPELASLTNVRPERIPPEGIQQHWIRFLLEDSYFGNSDFLDLYDRLGYGLDLMWNMGIKLKKDVTGEEECVTDVAYYRGETVRKYLRAAFAYAQNLGLPLISIDKANVMARGDYWRRICIEISREFPDVPLSHQLVDSANALLFTPAKLHGVIACGNEHGDILSDGAASALGSMGMMCSSAINPDTGAAMFESGAGTAPTLAGQDKANPLGRILTGAMMLRHLGATKGANAIEKSVRLTLQCGYRTEDIFNHSEGGGGQKLVGTEEMGRLVLANL
jgi:3-isopropylmalate dehydrogenase